MIKITVNSAIACALFLCSGTMAVAGSPYNLKIPAPGTQFKPHVANPSLKQNPVVNRSIGHARQPVHSVRKYTATTKARARRQGVVSAGGASWNCRGNRCTTKTAWTRPTVQTCKALASAVGAIQSYGTRGAGLVARDIRSCNTGIMVAKRVKKPKKSFNHGMAAKAPVLPIPPTRHALPKQGGFRGGVNSRASLGRPALARGGSVTRQGVLPKQGNLNRATGNRFADRASGGFAPKQPSKNGSMPHNLSPKPHAGGGFAPARPSPARGTTSGGSSPATSHTRGGFAPAGLTGQVRMRNALSRQQIAQIDGRTRLWENYKRAIEEKRRRDEAALQARIQRLSHEAYISGADCNDNDSQMRPDLLEVCDGKDNNCNGQIDEGVTILSYRDADGDGHGDPATAEPVCSSDIRAAQSRGEWLSTTGNDCNDADPDHWHDCPAAGSSR